MSVDQGPLSSPQPSISSRQAAIGALVLSAGRSTRQRGFKPLLPIGRRTVLEHCLHLFSKLETGPCQTVTVLGHRAEDLRPVVRGFGAIPVLNPDHDLGMFSSVQAGAAALSPSVQAFFVLPVDIPLVRPLTISCLLQAMAENSIAQAFVPCFAGRTGHPPLLRSGLRQAIAAHDGSQGLRGVLAAARVEQVEVPDRHILVDIDTPEQYRQALDLWQRRDIPSPDEAEALLDRECGRSSQVAAHSRAVARVAGILARGVNSCQASQLDPDLAVAAALLHDIAKGSPDHCAAGARRLAELGFSTRLTGIVAGHADYDPDPHQAVNETEVVYLADKLVQGDAVIPLDERFQAKLSMFADNPEAVRAVQRRWEQARFIADRIAKACGGSLPAL